MEDKEDKADKADKAGKAGKAGRADKAGKAGKAGSLTIGDRHLRHIEEVKWWSIVSFIVPHISAGCAPPSLAPMTVSSRPAAWSSGLRRPKIPRDPCCSRRSPDWWPA